VERKELARAIYAAVEVGGEVPPELYKAVAELLAYVYRLARRGERPAKAPVEMATAGSEDGR
jgi:flagellar biosynthesis protein FlhB